MCKLCCCSEPGPPQRGGTGPWEALEMWLRPSCALEPSLPLTLGPPDGFAGRGDGAQDLRQTCPPQLRAAGEGGGGSLCRRVWVVAYLAVGPVVPIVPTLRSHGRHCSDQRLTTQSFFKIKSCSTCPLSLSMGKAGVGGCHLLFRRTASPPSPYRALLCRMLGLSQNDINPPTPHLCRVVS